MFNHHPLLKIYICAFITTFQYHTSFTTRYQFSGKMYFQQNLTRPNVTAMKAKVSLNVHWVQILSSPHRNLSVGRIFGVKILLKMSKHTFTYFITSYYIRCCAHRREAITEVILHKFHYKDLSLIIITYICLLTFSSV